MLNDGQVYFYKLSYNNAKNKYETRNGRKAK